MFDIPNGLVPVRVIKKINRTIPQIHKILNKKHHYTILYVKNRIISIGWNHTDKTSPLAKRFNYDFDRIHSELASISKVRDVECLTQYKAVVAINLRLSKLGELNQSRPCPQCQELFKYFGIEKCVYSDEFGKFKEIKI
jgi:deoxycytidylate deaminase